MSHIFISYSTKNSDYAYKLADKLRNEGFDVWIDNAELRASEDWWDSIVKALRLADAFIVIMTPESKNSKWVQRELTLADNWGKPTFLKGEYFEIYVRTQFRDVRDGSLPEDDFYDDLARYSEQRKKRGDDLTTSSVESINPDDSELREALANPPDKEDVILSGRVVFYIVVGLLVIAIVIALINPFGQSGNNNPNNPVDAPVTTEEASRPVTTEEVEDIPTPLTTEDAPAPLATEEAD